MSLTFFNLEANNLRSRAPIVDDKRVNEDEVDPTLTFLNPLADGYLESLVSTPQR